MNCREFNDLISDYIDKELPAQEVALLESHLSACAACREELELHKFISSQLSALPDVPLPEDFLPRLKQRIESEKETEKETEKAAVLKPGARWRKAWVRAAATAAVLLLMFGVAADAGLLFRAASDKDGSEKSLLVWRFDYQGKKNSPESLPPPGESILGWENDYSSSMPPWVGYTFNYSNETAPTLNLFVEWIKSGGTKEVNGTNYSKYSYNRPFLDWVKDREDLVLPVAKNNDFRFRGIQLAHNGLAFGITFTTYRPGMENPETTQTLSFNIAYGNEEQMKKGLFAMLCETYGEEKLKKGECPWGEYWYINYAEDDNGKKTAFTIASFIYGDFLIQILPYGAHQKDPWNPEYFNYFDFETVPLK